MFLGEAAPDPTVSPAISDAASTNGGVNFTGYQPDLGSIFFVGDGKNSAGTMQNIYPLHGATRLFLEANLNLAPDPGVKFSETYYVDDNGAQIALTSTDGGVMFTSAASSFALSGG